MNSDCGDTMVMIYIKLYDKQLKDGISVVISNLLPVIWQNLPKPTKKLLVPIDSHSTVWYQNIFDKQGSRHQWGR